MRSYSRAGVAGIVLALALFAAPLAAWGPMTHLAVNARAYAKAALDSRKLSAVPAGMRNLFIGAGPAPDIKHNAGDEFPKTYHSDIDVVLRMVELAKSDPKYGLSDVAMALGWAGHLFAEVPSAHTGEGYPGTKIIVPLPKAGYMNHQLCELCTDILVYRDMRDVLRRQTLGLPVRLLEASMKAEHERDEGSNALNAQRIKSVGNAFLPTVLGVRTIADYLMEERPELLDEMDAFFGDRDAHIERSVTDVAAMLREHGCLETAKTSTQSADRTDKVRVALTGTLKDKAKTFVYNALYKTMRTGVANDVFTFVSYHTLDGIISNGLKKKFSQMAGKALGGSISGDKRHNQVITRFTEGLLCRHDLTFPEIIAYATEGLENYPAGVSNQRKQFAALGLAEDGRKRVTDAEVSAAVTEVQRIEDVRREWPWFWPFRPSVEKLAEARSRASRLLAFSIVDDSQAPAPLREHAQTLLKADRDLRTALWNSRSTSWITLISKLKNRTALEKAETAIAQQERFFAQLVESRRLKGDAYLSDLEMLRGTTATSEAEIASKNAEPGTSSAMPAKYAGYTSLELRALHENAYRKYTSLVQTRSTDDAETIAALQELREIDQARRALEAAAGQNR